MLYLPLLGIAINWYLTAQLLWTDLAFLVLFLSLVVAFYFLFGYHFSVGYNGRWDGYNSCRLSIHTKPSAWKADNSNNGETIVEDDAECKDQSSKDKGNEDNNGNRVMQGLPI